jgi:hypothetical protein
MVTVKMRDQDEVDAIAGDPKLLQRRQRRGPAVDQEIHMLAGDMEAGVVAPARAERVAAADKLQFHGAILAPSNERRDSAGNRAP